MSKTKLAPIHPGEILADELTEISISATELARQIKVCLICRGCPLFAKDRYRPGSER